MRHALKVNVFSVKDLGLCVGNIINCYTWPAAAADGYAANAGSGYGSLSGNSNPYMKQRTLSCLSPQGCWQNQDFTSYCGITFVRRYSRKECTLDEAVEKVAEVRMSC